MVRRKAPIRACAAVTFGPARRIVQWSWRNHRRQVAGDKVRGRGNAPRPAHAKQRKQQRIRSGQRTWPSGAVIIAAMPHDLAVLNP